MLQYTMGPTRRKPKASNSSGSKKELEKKPKKEYPRFLSGERFQLYSFASELPKPKPKPRHVTVSPLTRTSILTFS